MAERVTRRRFTGLLMGAGSLALLPGIAVQARQFLTPKQAQTVLMGKQPLTKIEVQLTDEQIAAIEAEADVNVRNKQLQVWKSQQRDWFILDQVIGKHEFIDIAVAISSQGTVTGVEVLNYRESYGEQVRHPKWLAQFHGVGPQQHLRLDNQIQNISGATLSCRHITDGINRLTQTWLQVLRHL